MSELLGPAYREALIAAPGIGDALDLYHNEPAIFTRRPPPADAPQRMIIIGPNAGQGDDDFLVGRNPWFIRDIVAYGDQPDDYRLVERIADEIYELFHRQKFSVTVPGFSVISIEAEGPFPAPVDDEMTVARLVSVTIRLRRT